MLMHIVRETRKKSSHTQELRDEKTENSSELKKNDTPHKIKKKIEWKKVVCVFSLLFYFSHSVLRH